jgi:dipeptidyl aminopeptidase/acylaminoacyl peptidase
MVVLGSAAGPASASFPGRNGAIVYGWLGEAAYRAGPVATSIRSFDPRTGLQRVLRDCPLKSDVGVPIHAECIVSAPRVSSDGRRVAFPTTQVTVPFPEPWQSRSGFGLMAIDGTGLEEHYGEHAYGPLAWSPAGDRLLLSRQVGELGGSSPTAIYLAAMDGTELGQVTPEDTGSPDWSSTGRIAFVRGRDIWLTRLGGTPRRLTRRGGASPSWSPHGSKLAFVRTVRDRQEVFLVERDGGDLRRLTRRGGYSPSWSPDGRWIAFVRAGSIYVVRTKGGGLRRVVEGFREPEFGEGQQVLSLDWQALPTVSSPP